MHTILVSTMAADGLAPFGARASADTVMDEYGSWVGGWHLKVNISLECMNTQYIQGWF